MRWNTIILSLIICLTCISSYAGAIYKWTDDDGNVHYAQIRPKNVPSERVNITGLPRNSQTSTYAMPSLDKKHDTDNQSYDKASSKKSRTKKSASNQDSGCKAAKSNLKTLLSSGRVRSKDNEGNISYMSDDQKKQRIKQEKEYIKRSCK